MELHRSNAAAPRPRATRHLSEFVRKLEFDIELARLPPGELIAAAAIARRIRCHPQDLRQILAEARDRGLLSLEGEACRIAPVDRARLLPHLARPRERALFVADRAARRVAPLDEEELADASILMTRSALLGDIEGFMAASLRQDHVMAVAADLPEAAADIKAIDGEFRRAWCAYNRLRDINEPAAIRRDMADAVLNRRPEAAKKSVEVYFRYLRRAF